VLIHRLRFGDIDRLFGDDEKDIGEESDDNDPLRVFEPERFSQREVNAALKLEFSELTKG
jgi:hypothetical protein